MTRLLIALALTIAVATSPRPRLHIPANAAAYRARVVKEAHVKGGLAAPVAMFAGQLSQESQFNPNAHSGVGAQGLAQFMPASADFIANLYPKDLRPGAPYDADWSIRALVYYDYWIYQRVPKFQAGPERWGAALSSYNAGLGWVLKDQKATTGCDATLWFGCVENTPDVRSASNRQQSKQYPEKIIHQWEPLYVTAGWQ